MSNIKIKLAAKTNLGVVRTNNEDNLQVIPDVSSGVAQWRNNEIFSLGELGTLLVVADGMGGMNAGEVASEIAIRTVNDCFNPARITSDVLKDRYSIEKFMNSAIVEADERIKREAKARPETSGMGTTIVIGWILNGYLYVSWCGDSRAYVYNSVSGLQQISKDHSYVQSLVDKGEISKEDAFDYPDSNIITRSLSDYTGKANPDSLLKPYEICNDDIILLCTDGLNGMIRDIEIQRVIEKNNQDMLQCVDELIRAACEAAGADNITVCLCKILEGAKTATALPLQYDAAPLQNNTNNNSVTNTISGNASKVSRTITKQNAPNNLYKKLFYVALAVIIALLGVILYLTLMPKNSSSDTLQIEPANTLPIPANNSHIIATDTILDKDNSGNRETTVSPETNNNSRLNEISNEKNKNGKNKQQTDNNVKISTPIVKEANSNVSDGNNPLTTATAGIANAIKQDSTANKGGEVYNKSREDSTVVKDNRGKSTRKEGENNRQEENKENQENKEVEEGRNNNSVGTESTDTIV